MKAPAVYILARAGYERLHVGVTSDLVRRIRQHRNGPIDGSTRRYGVGRLAYFQVVETMPDAITRSFAGMTIAG